MQILLSTNTSPELNAAYEEFLFRQTVRREATAFLYLNQPSVFIGRNQNPWAECNLGFCQKHNIRMVRRISGGGTVYHDLHNLNVALLLPRKAYNPEKLVRIIITALAQLGVPDLYHNDHFSIFSQGRKLCGSAFALAGKAALLHACILVGSNLNTLTEALTPPRGQMITGAGVGSNRMPVTSICDFIPEATVQQTTLHIVKSMLRTYTRTHIHTVTPQQELMSNPQLKEYARKFQDPKWTFGRTNDFILEKNMDNGFLKLTVSSGFVSNAIFHTMREETITLTQLVGLPLTNLNDFLMGNRIGRP